MARFYGLGHITKHFTMLNAQFLCSKGIFVWMWFVLLACLVYVP